jgi:hypothetical protein
VAAEDCGLLGTLGVEVVTGLVKAVVVEGAAGGVGALFSVADGAVVDSFLAMLLVSAADDVEMGVVEGEEWREEEVVAVVVVLPVVLAVVGVAAVLAAVVVAARVVVAETADPCESMSGRVV